MHRQPLDWSRLLASESGLAEAERSDRPPAAAWGASRSDAIDRAVWEWVRKPWCRAEDLSGLRLDRIGAVTERGEEDAVEVWVDSELSVMHGLWRGSRLQGDERLRRRLLEAVAWHVEHTGTENATHRPWATHVFLLEGSPEARFFAEGQVHACRADGGPDACSRWILADAARELDLAAGAGST